MLVEAYGHIASFESTCRQWFKRYKNHNFDLEDREREGAAKIFEDPAIHFKTIVSNQNGSKEGKLATT